MRKLNAVVMTLAGLLLIAASILKAHEVLNVYYKSWHEKGLWESWEFFLVQIPVEFSLGVWLVSGLFRKAAWLVGTLAYVSFVGVTLYKGFIGAESCGCFGQVHVNPWVTLFAIDIPFSLLLLIFRPRGLPLLPPPWPRVGHALATAVPIFAALIFTAPALVAFRPEFIQPDEWAGNTRPVRPTPQNSSTGPANGSSQQAPPPQTDPSEPTNPVEPVGPVEPQPDPSQTTVPPTDPGQSAEPDQTTAGPDEQQPAPATTDPNASAQTPPVADPNAAASVTEPDKTVPAAPKLWPWLEYVDIAEQIKEGIVIVYMYHYDCPICAESIPKFEEYSKKMADTNAEAFKIAYLAVPPYGKEGEGPVPADTLCLHGKLTNKRNWAITSPFVLALIEGEVVKQWPQGEAPEPDKILDVIFAP